VGVPLRRAVFVVVAVLAFQLVGSTSLYALLGIDHTLDLVARTFAATYPIVDGRVAFPIVEWDRAMFNAHRLATYAHIIPSALALLIGPFQLWTNFRQARPRLHRALGIVYVGAQLVGLPSGMYLSRFEYGGLTATYGFFGMGLTTLVCTALGVRSILVGDRAAHRTWMIRGYGVLWSSAVVFRWILFLALPHLARPLPGGFREPYVAFVFLSWAIGLLAADLYLHLTRPRDAVAR
jgi:uncharacterized membrane protein